MNKVGLIVFGNSSGIGYQSRRLAQLIKPDRILYIDSTTFSKNKIQHPEWYDGFSGYKVAGFPTNHEVRVFLNGLTHVLCVENPLNYHLTALAKNRGIKVYIQTNFEFCDSLNKPNLTLPYKFLMPSMWHIKTMEEKFGRGNVEYLPPPIDPNEFKEARDTNFSRSGRRKFLHVAGTVAAHDRNGTLDVLHAIALTRNDFELTITSQHELPKEYMTNSSKVRYQIGGINEPAELYKDYDALILPRRYGGLCLPMNEALMSGLPVIMTDIEPNNKILPKKWLVPAYKSAQFMTRTMIDIHRSNVDLLARKLDALAEIDSELLESEKIEAFDLAHSNFSVSALREDYSRLWI